MATYSTYLRIVLLGVCSITGIILAVFSNTSTRHEESAEIENQTESIVNTSLTNSLAGQPLRFIENQGQTGTDARYHVQGAGHTVLFNESSIEFRRIESTTERNELVLEFEGANPTPAIEGVERLSGVAHFFQGSNPDSWRRDVPTYGAVIYRDLYPGIDMAYLGDHGALESEFYLSPGADHESIRLNYGNVKSTSIRDDGVLILDTDLGELIEKAPIAYQEIQGVRIEIEANYVLLPDEIVGIELGEYDPEYAVVIDPELIFQVTYGATVGGTSANGVAIDSDGNVILAGGSNLNFPVTDTIAASNDASWSGLLTKLDGTSGAVIYSALFGGSKTDGFQGLALDQEGNIYLTGSTTSDDFPTMNPTQGTRAGGYSDAFLVILTADIELTFSTYLGGSDLDEGGDVVIDGAGNVFVAGTTTSSDFPVSAGAFQQIFKGGDPDSPWIGDNFVTKYNAAGSVDFSTYLGGSGFEGVCGIEANASGQLTIAGRTGSADFPLANAYQSTFGGGGPYGGDITVSRLNGAGDKLIYSTYIGGASGEECSGIALGPNDDVFVSGGTRSQNFPVVGGDSSPEAGSSDGVLVMLDNAGQPVYSVRSNMAGDDEFVEVTVDDSSAAYPVGVSGDTIAILKKSLDGSPESVFEFEAPRIRVWAAHAAGGRLALAGDNAGAGTNASKSCGGEDCSPGGASSGSKSSEGYASDWDFWSVMINLFDGTEKFADLSVESKTVEPDTAWPGEEVTYKIKVKNNGPDDLDEVGIHDTLPEGIEVSESELPDGCTISNGVLTCSTPLKFGAEREFEFKAKVSRDASGSIHNQALVTSGENTDPERANDSGFATLAVRPMVTKVADPNTVFHRIYILGAPLDDISNPLEETNLNDDFTELVEDLFTPENQGEGSTMQVFREPRTQDLHDAIEALVERALPGEEVTIIFNGHGWDGVTPIGGLTNDSFDLDEVSGGDATISLNDNSSITDDTFADWLSELKPGVTLTFLTGSCYGGGFTGGAKDLQESQAVAVLGPSGDSPQDTRAGAIDIFTYGLSGMFVETFIEAVANGAGERLADANNDGVVTTDELKEWMTAKGWELGSGDPGKHMNRPEIPSSQQYCGSPEIGGRCPGLPDTDLTFEGDSVQIDGRFFHANADIVVRLIQTDFQTLDTLGVWKTTSASDSTFTLALKLPERVDQSVDMMFDIWDDQGFYDWWITSAGTFTIDSDLDGPDAERGDLACATEDQSCTLRAAIEEANQILGPATILTTRPISIMLDSTLAAITDAVSLDGGGRLEIDGTRVTTGGKSAGFVLSGSQGDNALTVRADRVAITGISMHTFPKAGVAVESGVRNTIRRNTFANVGQPIDLGADGPTENDPGDADEGPNRLMNTPEIRLSEESASRFTVHYTVDSDPANAAYPLTIDFYALNRDEASFAWVGEHVYTEEGGEQKAVFFASVEAGVDISATATDADGNTSEFSGQVQSVVDVEADELPPAKLILGASYPNPFSGSATIPVEVPREVHVGLYVYDMIGHRVATITDGVMLAGRHKIEWDATGWDGRRLASGTYLVRLESAGENRTSAMVIVQ